MLRLDRGDRPPERPGRRENLRWWAGVYGAGAVLSAALGGPALWVATWVDPDRGRRPLPEWMLADVNWALAVLLWLAVVGLTGLLSCLLLSRSRGSLSRDIGRRSIRLPCDWSTTVSNPTERVEASVFALEAGFYGPAEYVACCPFIPSLLPLVVVPVVSMMMGGGVPSEPPLGLGLATLVACALALAGGDSWFGAFIVVGVWMCVALLNIIGVPVLHAMPWQPMLAATVLLVAAQPLSRLRRAHALLFTSERGLAVVSEVPKRPWTWARLLGAPPSPPAPRIPVVATEWRRTDPVLLTSLPSAALVVVGPPGKRWWMRVSDRDGQELAEYLAEKHWSFEDRRGSFPVRACRLLVNTALVLLILALAGVQSWFIGRLLGQSVVAAQVGLPALDLAERGDAEGFQQALGPVLDQRPNDPVLWALYATSAERLDLTSAPAAWMRVYTLVDGGGSLGRAAASRLGLPAAVSPP